MNLQHTASFDRRVQDRWFSKTGGTNSRRRSGRYTKKGARPRAAHKGQVRRLRADQERERKVERAHRALVGNIPASLAELRIRNDGWVNLVGQGQAMQGWITGYQHDNSATDPGTDSVVYSIQPHSYSWNTGVDFGPSPDTTSVQRVYVDANAIQWPTTDSSAIYSADTSGYVTGSNFTLGGNVTIPAGTTFGTGGITIDNPPAWQDLVIGPGRANPEWYGPSPAVAPWGGSSSPFMWQPDLKQQAKDRWRRQLTPTIVGRATRPGANFDGVQHNEIVALQLLKSMLDEQRWRKYLRYGFVMVRGKSGLRYQIRRGEWHVLVWNDTGKKVAELCVDISNARMPPTDKVIARMLMAECDEANLWRKANVDTQGDLMLRNWRGEPAWQRHHSSPDNHLIMERLAAA